MTDLNLPSIFVPLVGLVFPAMAMTSLFLYVQNKYDCLVFFHVSNIIW